MPTPAQQTDQKLPVVVLVGRTNVGKSTLFNKLIEQNKALVSLIAGTTRSNNEGDVLWRAKYFHLIDTGGQDSFENEPFADEIIAQAESAIEQADIIVMVVDAKVGVLPQEKDLVKHLQKRVKKTGAQLMLVANKADSKKIAANLDHGEWLKLTLGKPIGVSAASGSGIGDFLEIIHKSLRKLKRTPKVKKEIDRQDTIRISLVGKPNVGKSSLFNKLIGQEKVIVSDIAHTTRESFDTDIIYKENDKLQHRITFIDTAGMRRKAKVSGILERGGIGKTIESIESSDMVLLVLDATESISSQDMQIGGLVARRSKSVIIVVNKWDLVEDHSDTIRNKIKTDVYSVFPHLKFAPIIFTSGKTGYRIHDIFPMIVHAMNARKTAIPNPVLHDFIENIQKQHRPSRGKGTRHPRIMGLKQINSNPPIFEIYIKYRTSIHRSYVHFIENRLRENFDFTGVPIIIKMTKMKR